MTMESRSIDFAKTASIDLMGLNNKVVNMRQVVRRTKVQVINKLCRNIDALKKKKGTEEQKTKNLSKAERYLEEIDSIKKLKDDKVSKYALASTRTFSDVCKESLSAGPRALGRLADHPLMKKLVSDFREQHSDWQDLAAFLLIKQTGRRFKTKKQKQKKLSKCVENINASETMTKIYIQERFGKEGLEKAEKKFESKNKKSKQPPEEAPKDKLETKKISDLDKDMDEIFPSSDTTLVKVLPDLDDKLDSEDILETNLKVSNSKSGNTKSNPDKNMQFLKCNVKDKLGTSVTDKKNVNEDCDNKMKMNTVESDLKAEFSKEDEDSSDSNFLIEHTMIKKPMQKEQGKPDDGNSIDDSSSLESVNDSSSESENDSYKSESDKDSSSSETENDSSSLEIDDDSSSSETEKNSSSSSEREKDSSSSGSKNDEEGAKKLQKSNVTKKKSKKKNKPIPEFLLKAYAKPVNDPFFGSGDENDDGPIRFEDNELLDDNDIDNDDLSFKRGKIESMFYNPENKSSKKGNKSSKIAGRFNKKDGRANFDGERRPGLFKKSKIQGAPKHSNFKKHSVGGKPVDKSRKFGGEFTSKINGLSKNIKNTGKPLDAKKVAIKSDKLHPSWEASRKRKAEQAGIAEFKGKKITFDDDD